MISVLVVGPTLEQDASIEVLTARDADEAVEKLARNRRVDAVVIVESAEAARIAAAILEDILSPPPIFLAAGGPEVPGVRNLPDAGGGNATLLRRVVEALQGPPDRLS